MDPYIALLIDFAKQRPQAAVLVVVSALTSLTALYFVLSRRKTPSSEIIVSSAPDGNALTDEVLTIIVEKKFVRDIIEAHLRAQSKRPRFTFSEFITYGVPAIISLFIICIITYLIVASRTDQLQLMTGILTTIIGYYFGTAATHGQR